MECLLGLIRTKYSFGRMKVSFGSGLQFIVCLVNKFTNMKKVEYKGLVLAKGSKALELWQDWQNDKSKERNKAQKKLDDHMKDVETRHKELLERYK